MDSIEDQPVLADTEDVAITTESTSAIHFAENPVVLNTGKSDDASEKSELDEELEDLIEQVLFPIRALGNPWVDNPRDDLFTSHRKLISYMNALYSMDGMLRDTGKRGRKEHPEVVKALFEYTKKAHAVLLPYIHKWIQNNENHPALRKVQELISNYEGVERLERY